MFEGVVLGLYGSILGSFAGVCGMRIVEKQSFLVGRSHCNQCKRVLRWYELFPVLSFLYLKGRCRTCQQAIPKEIFIFELFFALFFPYLLLTEKRSWLVTCFQLLLVLILTVLAYIDLKTQLVPNQVHLYLICLVPMNFQGVQMHLKGGLIVFIPLLILSLMTAEGMGGGDVKLFGSLGFVLGWKAIIVVFTYAIFLSLPVAIYLKYWKQRDGLPFVPFITIATCLFLYLPLKCGY